METQVQERTTVERQMFTARFSRSVLLSPQTKHLEFTVEGLEEFYFVPGQFVSIKQPRPDGKTHTRAYSIASPPRLNATPSSPPNSPRHRRPCQKPRPANPLSSLKRRRRNRQNRRSKKNRRRSLKHPNRHRPNRLDQRLAKKSGSFNYRHARRRALATKQVRSNFRRRVKARRKKRNPDKLTVQPPVVKRRLHRAKPPNPPRRSPNLSRLRPAKSSSSNHRLSCANSPRNSSRSRSRSSPI